MTKPLWNRCLATFAVAGLGIVLGACEDLLTESPPHIIVADNLYVDLTGFDAGLAALHSLARGEREGIRGSNDLRALLWTAGTDNVFTPNDQNPYSAIPNLWNVHVIPSNPGFLSVWIWLYQTVNIANTIIDRAENPEVRWTQAEKERVVAEARFFRAWAYRHLTYLWGDVPLNLEESSGESVKTDWERTPVAQVRTQIEEDLLFAEEHLPAASNDPGAVVKAAAQHFLAELYLATGNDVQAEAKAAAVVNSGLYQLITERYGVHAGEPGVPFMDQFYDGNVNRDQGNSEILWAFQFQKGETGGGGSIMRRYWIPHYDRLPGMQNALEYGGRGIQRSALTRWAQNLYEAQDDRGSQHAIRWYVQYNNPATLPAGKQMGDTLWLSRATPEARGINPNWPWPRKFEWVDPVDLDGSLGYGDQPALRLAETYLLLAEAQFKQGKLAEAAQSLNIVRTRANGSPITPDQVTLDFILDERSRELVQEEHRRYTLLRTGTWLERTRAHNPIAAATIADHNVLYPIPQAVIDANIGARMGQNSGY